MRIAIASVNYGDMLAVTLPAWLAIVPSSSLVVATSHADLETQAIARKHGVPMVVTDAWTTECAGHVGGVPRFNLGHGVNVALGLCTHGAEPPADGELIGHVSADCYPVGQWPKDKTFAPRCLYGFWRHACLTPDALAAYQNGRPLTKYPRLKNSGSRPIGYCQLWRHGGQKMGSYPTAGKVDTDFVAVFPRWQMRDEIAFLHLGEHDHHGNWGGRQLPRWGTA